MATHNTFFSYSRADTDFVFKLVNDLREAGADIWIDQVDLKKGYWDSAIETALNSCTQLIVVLTPDSVSSDNVMDEVSFAIENKKTVIPVLLTECNVPFRLSRFQRIDFTGDYKEGLEHLLVAMEINEAEATEKATGNAKPLEKLRPLKKSSHKKTAYWAAGAILLVALLLWIFLPLKKGATPEKANAAQKSTDNSTPLSAADSIKKAKAMLDSIAIGATFRGGKIFYIDNTGRHGLIAAPYDQTKLITWNNGKVSKKGAYGTAVGDGKENTKALAAKPGDVIQAAKVCQELRLKGLSDWYLPSRDELKLLYEKRREVGGFADVYYWSSSEDFNADVWYQSFYNGKQYKKIEGNKACVRAIRSF